MPVPISSTISTRFLVISDTHSFQFEDHTASSLPLSLPLPKADVVLHRGDLTHCGGASSYKKALKMLGAFDAELKLVIAGNHDLELDERCWKTHLDEDDEPEDHDRAIKVMKGELAAQAGVTYLEEGTYDFTLKNGAQFTIYASPYTPACGDWAFAYDCDHDRFNEPHQLSGGATSIAEHPMPSFPDVDIVMTHGPPKSILDEYPQGNEGCRNLLHALRRARPRMHCYGHVHEANGMQLVDWQPMDSESGDAPNEEKSNRSGTAYPEATPFQLVHGQKTLMVNAAIMDGTNQPSNAPLLVDLDLPPA